MDIEISEQQVDRVSLYIDKKLSLLSPTRSKHCIFKVNDQLRKENEDAYEPKAIAIGPYHRGKNNLKAMEEHKFRYLQQVLQQKDETSVDRYVIAMRGLEERARNCYAESINLGNDEFVEMLLLDGCFIIQFFRKCMFEFLRDADPNDPIFQYGQTMTCIRHDLMLLENQLPFFVLDRLVNMTKSEFPKDTIIDLALDCLMVVLPSSPNASEASLRVSTDNVHHILGLIHEIWCSSFVGVDPTGKHRKQENEWEFIKSTTELQEAGVKFKKSRNISISLLNIKFKNGVMEIPPLDIDDGTERILRNLIAYEQHFPSTSPKHVTDYTTIMDYLINSAKDVEILRHKGIIINWLGDDETVSTMFNKIRNQVVMSSENFCYSDVFNNVNRHCKQRRNMWLANLRHNYFKTPWSIVSFIAAVVLLLLTLTQTIYSILSYHK